MVKLDFMKNIKKFDIKGSKSIPNERVTAISINIDKL